jgi:hypothetical protein
LCKILEGAVDAHQATPAPAERILHELAHGIKPYLDQLRAETHNQQVQIDDLRRMSAQRERHLVGLLEQARDRVADRERTIEAIMQGRVMRFMTGIQRRLRRTGGG